MISLKKQLFLDKLLGLPMVYLLNLLARTLGFFMNIDHSMDKPVSTIVVCKFIGMGSIIQATPLLQTLRLNYPKAKIVFVSTKSNQALLQHIPLIDNMLLLDTSSISAAFFSTLQILFKLWRYKINLYFDLELYSNFSTAIATCSLAVNRFGYFRKSNNLLLGIYTHMMYFNSNAPISAIYLQMARMAGCSTLVETLLPILPAQNLALSHNLNHSGHGLVINVNASEFALERRWGSEKFIELIDLICSAFQNVNIYLTGTQEERPYVETIYQQVKQFNVINLAGQLTLSELMCLINKVQLVVSNDSGPMHLSLALNKQTIGLFGPASPLHYGNTKALHVFYAQVYCSPCLHNFDTPPCGGDNQCMQRIAVSEVFHKAKEILLKNEMAEKYCFSEIIYTKMNSTIPNGTVKRGPFFI